MPNTSSSHILSWTAPFPLGANNKIRMDWARKTFSSSMYMFN